ncbi:ATP-dependent RNA helicase DBP10 [Cyathus striatus]|nr:ATP-dependent RNA helicase DBP10 [Cyathus striatus]
MSMEKRKRASSIGSNTSLQLSSSHSDDELDISSALTGKKRKVTREDFDEDDDELNDFIKKSIAKRDVKDGAQMVKKVKGKSKLSKGEIGGGSFQSMGLHPTLLRSLTLQGYRIPTPIQRLSIPALLADPPRDLVGMARTGSGKSLAYLAPLIQRLGGRHSTAFGARALIMLPTRELALQILKVGKELSRGWQSKDGGHAGDKDDDSKKTSGLRWGLIVGGEGLDDQFEMITNNPDIIIATPGRLLHLIVEMNLELKSVQYVVFDEADRLFEMGFETALNEILNRLPAARQTILFSATLPKSLVEFAKAGLQDPKLVRLDAESKISPDLKMAFFSVKRAEKDACLLSLLRDVIKVPLSSSQTENDAASTGQKKRGKEKHSQLTAPHQTLIFVATKHHVEYLTTLLSTIGYSVSHIYGSLDQMARTHQMEQFRRGATSILVVTDVAARGIDIPVLENVVNYDFPQGARVFVHRVGRTARAGRQGWAWSFVTNMELPYLLDLQLFLGRPLQNDTSSDEDRFYTQSLILGTFKRETIDEDVEYVRSLDDVNHSLPSLRDVMKRGHSMYERSKGKASPQSYKRAKEMMKDPKWLLAGSDSGIHPVLLRGADGAEKREKEDARKTLLRAVNSFSPSETIFETGTKGNTATASLMKERRKALSKCRQRSVTSGMQESADQPEPVHLDKVMELADEEDIADVFNISDKKHPFRDDEFYMSHYQEDAITEKGYSLNDGASSFVKQAQGVAFDLTTDEGVADRKKRTLNWDKKKKKFIKGGGVGADNVKLVKTESGSKLPATYRSGRFDEWKAKTRISLPRIGEAELSSGPRPVSTGAGGRRFRHNKVVAPKPLDKLSKNYERKVRQLKNREDTDGSASKPGASGKRYGGKSYGQVKNELKNSEQIRKERSIKEKKRAKNARPSRKKGKR